MKKTELYKKRMSNKIEIAPAMFADKIYIGVYPQERQCETLIEWDVIYVHPDKTGAILLSRYGLLASNIEYQSKYNIGSNNSFLHSYLNKTFFEESGLNSISDAIIKHALYDGKVFLLSCKEIELYKNNIKPLKITRYCEFSCPQDEISHHKLWWTRDTELDTMTYAANERNEIIKLQNEDYAIVRPAIMLDLTKMKNFSVKYI